MPSVQVALRLQAKGKHVKAKDVMSFIITGESSGSAENAAKNAYPVDEVVKPGSELKPDIDYYLHKQILPPVERLCAPISGTNITLLAACLGLDSSKYRVSTVSGGAQEDTEIHPLESQIPYVSKPAHRSGYDAEGVRPSSLSKASRRHRRLLHRYKRSRTAVFNVLPKAAARYSKT
jgi:hypothetical protein